MIIPVIFSLQRSKNITFYNTHIQIGKREYSAQLCGEKALETIADDILRLTVVAQVREPPYYIQVQDDTVLNPETEKAIKTLTGLLHDEERIIHAYYAVKNHKRTRVRTNDSPPYPVYH